MNTTKRLEARVKAVNRANAYAKMIYPKLAEAFKKFVGTKIYKADGKLMEKVKKEVPSLPEELNGLRHYRDCGPYSLRWSVQAWECADGIAMYADTSVYIGEVYNGVLTKICELHPDSFKSDYTAEDILAKREAYKAAKKIADAAEAALFPFGEYDR